MTQRFIKRRQQSSLLLVVQYDFFGFHTQSNSRRVLRVGGHEGLCDVVERLRGADQTTYHVDDTLDRRGGNVSGRANEWNERFVVGLLEHVDCYGNDCGKRQYAEPMV